MSHLTAPERETVITTSDADDTLTVWTAQRPMIRKLRANPLATLLEEGSHGSSPWAKFEVPADMLTIRSKRRQVTDAQREAAQRNIARMHAA